MAHLPPRLRDRLEREMAHNEPTSSPVRTWLIAVRSWPHWAIMLLLMQRFGAIDVPFLRGPAAAVPLEHPETNGPDGAFSRRFTQDPTAALIDSLKHEVETAKRSAAVHTASTSNGVSESTA